MFNYILASRHLFYILLLVRFIWGLVRLEEVRLEEVRIEEVRLEEVRVGKVRLG